MRSGHVCESVSHTNRDMNLDHRLTLNSCTFRPEPRFLEASERLCNGLPDQSGEADQHRVTSEDDSRSLPPSPVEDEDNLTPEIQQAYRIFQSFLSEKHKATTAPFWHPIGPGSQGDEAPDSEMCFKMIDDKFVNREYESITTFVADFRLMLENCYRFHGVHHWMSKQAQKLEIILEQKLTLLSRTLREKTTLAVTSGGRFGTEDEKVPVSMSSRRRSVPRNLAAITVGGSESIMVQALRLEELQRAKDEKRQRELERKEAEEVSAKDMEEWERSLLSLAEPWSVHSMWELPAIGHFLCLAQTALNLPEIVFYELERCLLMPRCSSFLSKVMTSLLCPMHKRSTVHRRPPLPYRKWEAELRHKVQGWYQAVGRSEDQVARAEQLGLCHQFFWTVGEMNPLEEVPFHLLSFNQRVWLLKGLCDYVYETQKDVQDAVLGQPIHECRESILGYDAQDNAYIHFPHFCGADLRIYRQSPCHSMEFPLPPFGVRRSEEVPWSEVKEEMMEFDGVKIENVSSDSADVCTWNVQADSLHDGEELMHSRCTEDSGDVQERSMQVKHLKEENEEESDIQPFFRVGDNCYKGKSPALNSHTSLLAAGVTRQNLREKRPCTECSEASTQHCSDCQIWNHVQPEIQRQRHDDSMEDMTGTTCVKKKKRKKKREFSVRKTNTDKLNKKKRVKDRLLNRKKKKQKLRKAFDMKFVLMKRRAGSSLLPVEPSFQLVCSSLDDLRRLISQTEDELDELNSTKKRSGRLPHKRSTVKELHITLIRLLNELLPWEPKLVKAFQKNRARLKKECDDFKKHPEYKNFTREQIDTVNAEDGFCKDLSLSTETTGDLEDGEFNSGQTLKEDSETAEHINKFGDHKSRCLDHRTEIVMACTETGHFTRGSKRRHSLIKEELSTFKRGKTDPESSLKKTTVEAVSQDQTTTANTQPSERASVLSEPVRSFQGTFKPIQALLAKSVGNKVTLINHPQAAFMAQRPQEDMTASAPASSVQPSATCSRSEPVSTVTPAVTSTSESTNPLVYKTEGGVGLLRKGGTSVKFSVQSISNEKPGNKLTRVVFMPSNLLIQNTEIKAAQQSPKVSSVSIPSTNTYLSNVPGYTVTEDKVPVLPVSPQKDISDVRTPSAAVLPTLRTLPTSAVPKKTTEPKVALNRSTTKTTCTSTKPDAKQELRTVCIRDSQSILVTTRGGNTGVVKVQRSEKSGTDTLKPSPVFAISPQLQAFLVSKVSTSTTQTVTGTISARSLPAFSPVVNRVSSQSNNIIPFSSSAAVTGTLPSSILNQVSNNSSVFASPYLTKTVISDKSPLLSKSNDSVLVTVKEVQQNTLMKPSQQAVLLINPSSNITSPATKIPMTTSTGTMPVMSIKHPSVSENSTLAIPKGASTLNANVSSTSPALEALRVIPNLQAGFGCTTSGPVTNIQSISLPGSTSMILSTNKNMSPVSNKITPVIVTRALASSMSSGLQSGQQSNAVARINESGIGKSFLKAAGSVDGKTLFSTLGTGHMASSALLSVVKQDTSKSTVLNALNNKPGLVVGSSTSDLSSSFSGSFINKHTMLLSKKPQMISSLCTLPSTVNTTSVTSTAGLSHPSMLSNSIQTHTGNSSTSTTSVVTSGMRPNSSVQEKIVINTTTPLAPGTQLLINNTKLLVPPQGLGPGSHVLFISSSSPGMVSGQGVNSGLMPTPTRSQNTSVIQGMKLVTPHQTLVRLPSPTRAKAGSSDRVHQQVNISTPPSPATVSQVTQPCLANVLRLPLFQPSDDKGHTVTPSQNTSSCPPESSVVSLSQRRLLSTTSTLLLQTRLDNTPPQNKMASVAPPVKTVITQSAPVVTRPAMSSTMSRMQKLPVATVPPIGCPNISQATPVATVPPSMNTVIKTQWQPMTAVQTVGKPVVLCQQPQTQCTSAVQISSSNCTASKLLLSPDGAILSIVQASEPSNVQKTTNPMTTGVTLAVLNTNDPLRKADIPDGLND